MGEASLCRRFDDTNKVEQLGIYPIGDDGRPTGDVVMPEHITALNNRVFRNNSKVTTVDLPYNLKSMEAYSFENCTGLKEIDISNEVTTIPNYCFSSCTNLKKVQLPKDLTNINTYAFHNCTNLQNIIVPDEIKSIQGASYLFNKCSSLTNEAASAVGKKIAGTIIEYMFAEIPNITEITVQYLGQYFFNNCYKLTKVTILKPFTNGYYCNNGFSNNTVIQEVILPENEGIVLDTNIFYNCTSLKKVNIPKTITTINEYAFYRCTSLTEIHLPESITTIHYRAFSGCTNLMDFYIDKLKDTLAVPANRWEGNSNARIHWKSFILNYTINAPGSVLYVGGEKIDESNKNEVIYSPDSIKYVAYNPDYVPQSGYIRGAQEYQPFNLEITLKEDPTACKIIIKPQVEDSVITISYRDFTCENNYVVVPTGTKIKYKVTHEDYRPVEGELTVSETATVNIAQTPKSYENIAFIYPFDNDEFGLLNNLVDGYNFIIDSGSSAIASGPSSYHVYSGYSFGYIKFITPEEYLTSGAINLSVTASLSCYNGTSYNKGCIYLGTKIFKPTMEGLNNFPTDGYGDYLMKGTGVINSQTYTKTLDFNTTYYLSCIYAKNRNQTSNSDRLFITNITLDCYI